MKKHRLGIRQSLSLFVTSTLAIFNLGLFGILLISGNQLSTWIKQNFELQIFLQKNLEKQQIVSFRNFLLQQPFVVSTSSNSISFISKEQAGEVFRKETGEDFAEFLGENPLRDAFSLKINEFYLHDKKLTEIKSQLLQRSEVFEVVYIENLAGKIQENLARISILFISITLLFMITLIWMIRNTIKLSIHSSRFLIRSMELVGARQGFIQAPFIKNMAYQGLWAGILAAILLQGLLWGISNYHPPFTSWFSMPQVWILEGGLIFFGVAINSFFAFLSVRRFIGKPLDYLFAS